MSNKQALIVDGKSLKRLREIRKQIHDFISGEGFGFLEAHVRDAEELAPGFIDLHDFSDSVDEKYGFMQFLKELESEIRHTFT